MNWVIGAALLAASVKLPDGPEKKSFVTVCGTCHDPEVVIGMVNTREGWSDLVEEMMARGGVATAAQKEQIVRYLFRNYPQHRLRKR